MFTDIVWRFLILEMFVMGTLCCTCQNKHPQTYFCKSEFVLKVKIEAGVILSNVKAFSMEIRKVFKGDLQELDLVKDGHVFVTMPGNCSSDNMTTGDKYFLFGNNVEGGVYSDLCFGNRPWEIATKFYKRGLANYYQTGCDCIDEMPEYTVANHCHWMYSYLISHVGNCTWAKTRQFRRCKMALSLDASSK